LRIGIADWDCGPRIVGPNQQSANPQSNQQSSISIHNRQSQSTIGNREIGSRQSAIRN
jgi:hypothetical protein